MQIGEELTFWCSDETADEQELSMARFDPNTYPDRLAFEEHARRIRSEEIDKAFHAAGTWLQAWCHEHTSHFGKLAVPHSAPSQRRVAH